MERKYFKIYTSESSVAKPRKLLAEIFAGFKKGKFLGWRLFIRNINALYRQSIPRFVWAFFTPLATGLVWTGVLYPLFVLTRTIL